MTRGRFIAIEGGEGAGKSTSLRAIFECLESRQIGFLATREPGGTELGEKLRQLLLDPETPAMDPETELLLVFASRLQNVVERIEPALTAGTWVVADRFVDASYAYQGGGRGVTKERIATLQEWALGSLTPDLTLLLDVSPEVGLQRAVKGRVADRFEREQMSFYERVRQAYLDRVAENPGRYIVVDARLPQPEMVGSLKTQLMEWIDHHA